MLESQLRKHEPGRFIHRIVGAMTVVQAGFRKTISQPSNQCFHGERLVLYVRHLRHAKGIGAREFTRCGVQKPDGPPAAKRAPGASFFPTDGGQTQVPRPCRITGSETALLLATMTTTL